VRNNPIKGDMPKFRKVRKSNKNISPHGGVVPILNKLQQLEIPKLIRQCLPKRKHNALYGFDDVFVAWTLASLCGATRLEHLQDLKEKLAIIPDLKIPSHDTVGRVFKSLGTPIREKRGISNKKEGRISYTRVNDNLMLNEMLILVTIKMGLLVPGERYTMDIDATFVATKCYDSEREHTYNRLGYAPMVCLIDKLPVFISLRSGNANSAFEILNCLRQCVTLLEKYGITVGRVISDGAGEVTSLMDYMDSKGIKFIVRKPFRKNNKRLVKGLAEAVWTRTEIHTTNAVWDCEITDFPYETHESTTKARIVCLRVPDKDTVKKLQSQEEKERRERVKKRLKDLDKRHLLKKFGKPYRQGQWVNHKGYDYKVIITNDMTTSPKSIILTYNKRGGAERNFSYLKADFAWKWPPFMYMNQNTVFLIAAALANNLFRGVLKLFKKKIYQLRLNMTLETFRYKFINVAWELIDGIYEYANSNIAYEKLM
jgi:hypothetical protein